MGNLSPKEERAFLLSDVAEATRGLGDLLDAAPDLHMVSPAALAALVRCVGVALKQAEGLPA